jgi:hypothetical protein
MTPENVGKCGDFWNASRPKQTQAPARAYRNAIVSTLNAGNLDSIDLKLKDVVRTVKIRCSNPPSPAKGEKGKTNLRIRVTAELKEMRAGLAFELLYTFYEYYLGGQYSQAVADKGARKYKTLPYLISDIAPICTPGSILDGQVSEGQIGSCPTRWKPSTATIYE